MSMTEFSSCPPSPLPPIPPLPKDPTATMMMPEQQQQRMPEQQQQRMPEQQQRMPEHFQTVQPDVPPRDDSFNVTAVYSSDPQAIFTEHAITSQAPGQRRSLIEPVRMAVPGTAADPQLSPRLGGPGSAFRPYASSENLFEPSLFPATKPPISNGHNTSEKNNKRHSTSSLKPPKIMESDEDFFRPKPRQLRAPIMSTTDTEPEMKEFNLGPIGGDKKGKKYQKAFYSTSETEEEYQAYLKCKPKWHGKGGHKDSWDPLQIASPPQIVQQQVQPVGLVQKPVPQAQPSTVKIERGAQLSAAYVGSLADQQLHEAYMRQMAMERENVERIQKSDTIVEMRQKSSLSSDRIQKSTSVIEVIPSNINKAVSMSPRNFKDLSVITEGNKHSTENLFLGQQQQAKSTNNLNMSSSNNNLLQLPQVSSPPDSEDQATPQAPRKQFLPNQTSVDSMNSFSEPEESNENLAPQLKSNKEDPETKKKKEIHKNLMSEALKKVELRNNLQKKTFSQLSRTNPGIAALDIETRKELKIEELANKQEQEIRNKEQEILRNRNRSGSTKVDDSPKISGQAGVNANVLNSFRQQNINRGAGAQQNSASREASIQAKKAGTPGKPEVQRRQEVQSPPIIPMEPMEPPVVILKKQPRILDSDELKARQKMEAGKVTPNIEMRSAAVKSPDLNNGPPPPNKTVEKKASVSTKVANDSAPLPVSKKEEKVTNDIQRQDSLKKTPNEKESQAVKANDKVSVAQQKMQNSEQKLSAKQSLQGLIQVKPKNPESGKAKPEIRTEDDFKLKKNLNSEESNSKIASVKKAAEKYENKTVQIDGGTNPNSHLRLRSKSISNSRKDQFADGSVGSPKTAAKANLPWAAKSPPVLRKRDAQKSKGYALQLSKSSDSITAAKLLAKARAENNNNNSGLRINQNFSKSIEKQIDVYSKTKEEIRMILSLAKSGSVVDRVNLFSNMTNIEAPKPDLNAKAESIRREIEEARANAQETVSDTEIEFQEPIESKVKPLKIPMKPKLIDNSEVSNKGSPETRLRINQNSSADTKEKRISVEELPSVKSRITNYLTAAEETTNNTQSNFENKPKPILKTDRSSKERSRSPRKKTPKLVSDHYLAPDQSFQIYAQSATDMSATEDEAEARQHSRKISVPAKLPSHMDPGPNLLRVPNKGAVDKRPTGIVKSKSFATTGQFECFMERDEISSKKETMMAFFGSSNPTGLKSIMKKPAPVRRSSLTSITDEVVAEEDLVDIDAEFESLLNSTFEKESAGKGSHPVAAGGGKVRAAGSGPVSKHSGAASKLQKSQSFSTAALLDTSSSQAADPRDQLSGAGSDMQQQPLNQALRAGFDPVAALPSSSQGGRGRKGPGGPTPPPHSPSPTQSEYDTADPWEDY